MLNQVAVAAANWRICLIRLSAGVANVMQVSQVASAQREVNDVKRKASVHELAALSEPGPGLSALLTQYRKYLAPLTNDAACISVMGPIVLPTSSTARCDDVPRAGESALAGPSVIPRELLVVLVAVIRWSDP